MKAATTVAALLLAILTAACGREQATLHLYTWADYIKPELVARFEKENECRVVIDTFDSNEAMYAKLKAGATGYDVAVPSSYMAKVMWKQGMLLPLGKDKMPNLAGVDPEYLKIAMDKHMAYSAPYMVTITGIAYLKGRVSDFQPTWAVFERADLKGRMTMLNDMRETIGAALKFLGYSLNTTNEQELRAARDVVIRWRRNLAKFENEQYKNGLASAEFLLVQGYSGDILQVQEENQDVVFAVPREGTSIACDDLVLLKGAPNPELGRAFINFLHKPDVAAENTEFISYLCPNAGSYPLLSEETRANPTLFPSADVRQRTEVIDDLGSDNAKYTKIWDEIKASE